MKRSFAALSLTLLGIACKFTPALGAERIPVFVKELLKQGKRQEAIQALIQQRVPRGAAAHARVNKERALIARQFVTNEGFQLYQDGVNLLEAQRFEEAREKFKEALARDPDNIEILIRLGQVEVLLERPSPALDFLNRAKGISASEPEASIWAGRAFILDKKWADAIEQLKSATASLPRSEEATIALSKAYRGLKQVERANAVLSEDLERNPYHLNVLIEWAEATVESEKINSVLWKVRKELQLGLSRLSEYTKRNRKFESDLALPVPATDSVKGQLEKLLKETDLKISNLRPTAS